VAIKVTDLNHIPLTLPYFKADLLFPYVRTPSAATGRYTLRNFSCMVITSCTSVAVSGCDAEWLLGGNLFCNILMVCYRCFCRIVHRTYLSVPSHSNLYLSNPIPLDAHYNINMEYKSIKIIKFIKV